MLQGEICVASEQNQSVFSDFFRFSVRLYSCIVFILALSLTDTFKFSLITSVHLAAHCVKFACLSYLYLGGSKSAPPVSGNGGFQILFDDPTNTLSEVLRPLLGRLGPEISYFPSNSYLKL